MNLKRIEKRIIEIKKEIAGKEKELWKPIAQPYIEEAVKKAIKPLAEELDELETERGFILDSRNSLFWKTVWNIAVPIIVSIITAILVIRLFN